MRNLLLILAVFAWALPGLAAQTFVVPITAVPGSVFINMPDGQFPSQSLPFSQAFNRPSCTGTFSAAIVNNGIEVEFDVVAPGAGCSESADFQANIEFVVPELGGTVTMVRVVVIPLTTDFPVIDTVSAEIGQGAPGSTSSVPGPFNVKFETPHWDWSRGQDDYPRMTGNPQNLVALIPGDTVLMPINTSLRTSDASSYVATIRMRYEFLVTVPEPSAALSLPIGVVTLFGLASLRG
jgi:hypothetical protein